MVLEKVPALQWLLRRFLYLINVLLWGCIYESCTGNVRLSCVQ